MSSRDKIDKIFPEVVKELGYDKVDRELNLDWLRSLFEKLSNFGPLFKILFYIAVTALLIFIIYKFISSLSRSDRKLKDKKINNIQADITDLTMGDLLAKINEYKNSLNYSLATLFLHYGTLHFLRENKLIQEDRDYTNREITYILSRNKLKDSFLKIATKTQGILFNNEDIDKDDFIVLENLFRSNYL